MTDNNDGAALVVPAFKHCPELKLNMGGWQTAMSRFTEAKNLVPGN
jgi:hypothetical protein